MKFMIIIMVWFILMPNLSYAHTQQAMDQYVFGKKLYADKMYELAAEQFHEFATQNIDNPRAADALYLAGLSYFNIKKYEQAQKEFLFLILRFPDAPELPQAQFKIAECFQLMGKLSEAGAAYRQVQIYYPKNALAEQAVFLSAKMFFDAEEYENAIEILSDFLETYPTNDNYYNAKLLLAESFINTNNYLRAQAELDKILSITDPGIINARTTLSKANLFVRQGLLRQAESEYKALINKYAISRYSKNEEISAILNVAYFKLAKIFRTNGMYETSNEYLSKITQENNPEVPILLADNFISMREYNKAILILESINTKLDSSRITFHFQKLGDCYYALQKFDNAIELYQKVIANCKENPTAENRDLWHQAYLKMSKAYLNSNKPEMAILYLKEYRDSLVDLKNKDAIDYQICIIYETRIGDFEQAIRCYKDFIERFPASKYVDEAQMGLARSYEKSGNGALALKEYQKLIDQYPASSYYNEAQKRIDYIRNYYQGELPAIKKLGDILIQIIDRDLDQRNRETLLYQLALNYFYELKDYQTVIELLRKLNMTDQIEKTELLYHKGRAFHLLGQKENIPQSSKSSYLDSAAYCYESIIQNHAESSWYDDALFHNIELQRILYRGNPDSSIKIKEALTEFMRIAPKSELTGQICLELARAILCNSENAVSSNDSLLTYDILQRVIAEYPESNLVGEAIFLKSNLFYKAKNFNQAEHELSYFISNFPKNHNISNAYFQYSKIAEKKNDYSKAADLLEFIITNYYYSGLSDSAKLNIGKYLLLQNNYSEALKYYLDKYQESISSELILIDNSSIDSIFMEEIIYNLSYTYKMLGNNEEAIKFFQEYLTKFSRGKFRDQALFLLGDLFNIQEDIEKQSKAIDYFQQLENKSNANEFYIKSILELADIYFRQNNIEQAYNYYSKALSLSLSEDQKLSASFQSINCLYKMGKINYADAKYNEFKKSYKEEKNKQAALLLEKALYFLNNKIFDQAENILKDVRSEFKNSAEGLRAEYLLGKLYFILNKNEEALELLTTLIMKNPENQIVADVYITLGNFYYLNAKQIENAMFAFKKATEQKFIGLENLKIAMHNLIKCYADLQYWEKAIALSREFISKFPLSEDIVERRIQIAYYYFRLNEYDYAMQLFKQILPEADIDNEPRIQFWIGECYFNKGEFQKAISEYLKILYISKPAKLLDQYKVTAMYQAAISYIKLHKLDNAKHLLQRIINEQGAESVFGRSARDKLDEIDIREEKKIKL